LPQPAGHFRLGSAAKLATLAMRLEQRLLHDVRRIELRPNLITQVHARQ
jgi:hypothetical protein